jgi:hypothetical protein
MSEHEQDRYGIVKEAEPIPIAKHSPFVVSTPNATAPDPRAVQAFNATVRRDLVAQRQQRSDRDAS